MIHRIRRIQVVLLSLALVVTGLIALFTLSLDWMETADIDNALKKAAHIYYVNGRTGNDNNNGLSRTAAVKTISRGAQLVQGGDALLIAPGIYYERPKFSNLGSSATKPVWIRAEQPGTVILSAMWEDAAKGNVQWQLNDSTRKIYRTSYDKQLFWGIYDGQFLMYYMDQPDTDIQALESLETDTIAWGRYKFKLPSYGIAQSGNNVYIKLPGGIDPNGKSIKIASQNTRIMEVVGSPYMIVDGIEFEGAGRGEHALNFDKQSTHATVRNCIFTHNRRAVRVSSNSIIEWSEYRYTGFYEYAERIAQTNSACSSCFNEKGPYYHMYRIGKGYYPSNWWEGALAGGSGEKNDFRYNYIHETFDGEQLGYFNDSESHHSVYDYNYDNHIELEGDGQPARDLRVHHSLFLASSAGSLSHQDAPNLEGPHYVYRNVIYDKNDPVGLSNLTQIKHRMSNLFGPSPKVYYYHNVIWGNEKALETNWGDGDYELIRLVNNIIIFRKETDSSGNNLENGTNYNLLVNSKNRSAITGSAGKYLGVFQHALDLLKFRDVEAFNFGILYGSVTVNAGTSIPDPHNYGFADSRDTGIPDIGVFPVEVDPGVNWPRLARTTFTKTVPERWYQ
jgi:hypothetical protein